MTDEPNKPADSTNTETQPVKEGNGAGTGGATFTQDDINRITAERAARAREAGIKELLAGLGFENPDDLKALVTAAKERSDKEKTELEKAQAALKAAQDKAAAVEQRLAEAEAARIADKVNGRIAAMASAAKAQYPEDVVKFLRSDHAEALTAAVGEGGAVDEKALNKLIEDVRKARPSWFGSTAPGSPSNAGGKPQQPDMNQVFGNKPIVKL